MSCGGGLSGQPTLSASESESDIFACGDGPGSNVTEGECLSLESAAKYGEAPCQGECRGGRPTPQGEMTVQAPQVHCRAEQAPEGY